ncbi:hypothetical protein [Chryseolinea soli]|uniref:hypothetical protein n=1 Tax=Chryseolinea soli TaxID=2321403 RepID=UPI00135CCA2A|nr:hypothetical protein [Chryseolinea soli]
MCTSRHVVRSSAALLLLFQLLILFPCFAQREFVEGSIVLTSGETVRGWIDRGKTKKNYKRCTFKSDKKGKARDYLPTELRSYSFDNGKHFIAKTGVADSSNYFAEEMLKSTVSLYTNGRYFFYSKGDQYGYLPEPYNKTFYDKRNDRYSRQIRPYVDTLMRIMSDCQSMLIPIQTSAYTHRSLHSVFRKYNTCIGAPLQDFDKQPWLRVNFKLGAGMAFTKFTVTPHGFPPFNEAAVDKAQAATFGGGISLYSPRVTNQLKLTLEGWYVQNKFHGRSTVSSSVNTYHYEFFTNVTSFKIPIGLQYNLSDAPFSPFVGGGFMDEIISGTSGSASLDIETGNLVTVASDPGVAGFRKYMLGFWLSAGVSQRISGRLAAVLMARYENMNGYIGDGLSTDSHVSALSAVVELQF